MCITNLTPNEKSSMKPILVILTAGLSVCSQVFSASVEKPNIIYILCDDLGYGDVQCLNPERGKIKTPHLDRLAGQGMIFTEAHSSSAVCTPTRYGILTGRYNWRTHLQQGVLSGYSPPLIEKDRLTVPGFLKQHGYETACIGKWHLGMATGPIREAVVHHSIRGNFAIRQGPWKLEFCQDSGGWSKGGATDATAQLYDMSKDVGERTNEYNQHPEIVSRLTALLEHYIAAGRSTPGPSLKNDVPVEILKEKTKKAKTKAKE